MNFSELDDIYIIKEKQKQNMKITTFLINLEQRKQLIEDGKMNKGTGGNIYDGVNVKDILNNIIKLIVVNPNIDITNEIKSYFKKAERYYLFDGNKMLFGLKDRAIQEPFEFDVTELFIETIADFINHRNKDLEVFKIALNEKIEQTEQYKEMQSLMKEWGY